MKFLDKVIGQSSNAPNPVAVSSAEEDIERNITSKGQKTLEGILLEVLEGSSQGKPKSWLYIAEALGHVFSEGLSIMGNTDLEGLYRKYGPLPLMDYGLKLLTKEGRVKTGSTTDRNLPNGTSYWINHAKAATPRTAAYSQQGKDN